MKNKEINKVFKQTLKAFALEVMKTGADFVKEIDDCKTNEDLLNVLEDNSDFLFEILNGECSSCEDKNDEIKELQDEVSCLEDSVADLTVEFEEVENEMSMGYIPKTLMDVYKMEAFKRAADKFTLSEIESLLD